VRFAVEDGARLLGQAIGTTVPLAGEDGSFRTGDIFVASAGTTSSIRPAELPQSSAAGAYRISFRDAPGVVVAGTDPEGARNGLYALLENLGFGFFRDGETVPSLEGPMVLDPALETESRPVFRWRGDMIWDHYLGPRRYCAAVWGEAEWERALVFMARKGMNFCEFYPPLEHVTTLAFPELQTPLDGRVWTARAKHEMAARVLARGRSLGLQFMYVLGYGAFPEPIRRLYPDLEWADGYLCAHQPELQEMSRRTWEVLLSELGTDHWYAIRHRGEEGQSYSDPCRSVTKAQGYQQAVTVMEGLDPNARITVWTWGETLPGLFTELPSQVRAVHIRHGMAGVFDDRGKGREQRNGPPELPPGRRWLSGQFTVFSGNETLIETGWSDARALASDALASAASSTCEGYFQWPEWSNTSPWLSEAVARLSWDPASLDDLERALEHYARRRHGSRWQAFLAGFLPLLRSGNARFMSPPRKRLLVPYFLAGEPLALLRSVTNGALEMSEGLGAGEPSPLFQRDFVDLLTWLGLRQAATLEAAGYLHHLSGENDAATIALSSAEATWQALRSLLSEVPDLGIVDAARSVGGVGPLSDKAVESFWELACNFYYGYPLVLGPEAIELVYLAQSTSLGRQIGEATRRGELARLEAPGWFWHDFPETAWADGVRKLPDEDKDFFEETMNTRLTEALQAGGQAEMGRRDVERAARRALSQFVSVNLPRPLSSPPSIPPSY
jgi:hypothetical protein